jgi:polysaccharide deacetylase 2 family uncharacterized protein YibQ
MARRRPPSRRSRSGLAGFWLFLLGVLVGAGILYLACDTSPGGSRSEVSGAAGRAEPQAAREEPRPSAKTPRKPRSGAASTQPTPPKPSESTAPGRKPPGEAEEPSGASASSVPPVSAPPSNRPARIALVIDDLGRSVDDLVPLEKLGVSITYSVLPFEENTPSVVAQLHRHREEILLHLPMQPKHGENPGPGALRLGMTEDQLRTGTLAALQAVPGAVGVNNHMGSGLSADARSMNAILRVLSSRGLFFLDSRTSPDSVGYRTALSLGVPAAERQVFLDSDPGAEAVHEQFQRLLEVARSRGAAVAIGHPHPDTLAALTAEVPRAKALGYDFVPVSYLLDRSGGGPE